MADDGRVYISRHVIFDEVVFPYAAKQQNKEAAGKAHNSVTRAVFPVINSASRICQPTQRAAEVVPPADIVEESTQGLHEGEGVLEGAVSLNNSGREDGLTGSEPEVTNNDAEAISPRGLTQVTEVIPLREGELTEVPDSLSTGGAQQQREIPEEQPLQHEGTSEMRDHSVAEPLEESVEE
ncbi:hypothetical protein V6N12_027329 [Hibiscus sabdariffa]|uniref:Uncharacterized protein n=1 Tax=Hibiscus sabdariffa TaxID=183260 RepID=A0ABR2DUE1_9ROSI